MSPTTVRLDADTRKMLDDYCAETGIKMSDALRQLVRQSLEQYQQHHDKASTHSNSLMVNEKRAIRASIESLYLLRQLVNDPQVLQNIVEQTDDILKTGWLYETE